MNYLILFEFHKAKNMNHGHVTYFEMSAWFKFGFKVQT